MRSRSTTLRPPSRGASPTPGQSSRSAERPQRTAARARLRASAALASVRRLWRWRGFDLAALGLLVLAIAALNQVWISIETRPPHWDMARHLGDSLVYLNATSVAHPLQALELYTYYPPFVYWVTDAFYAVFGTDASVAILSNVVFVAILAYSTYAIGERLWNRRVGLLSAVFVVTTPVLVSNFKEYMLDAPLTAMVALALYLLIRSESFSRWRPSLLLGVVCGLGLLTKWTFALFLAAPLALAGSVAVLRAARQRSPAPIARIAAAAALAFAICGVWYLHNWAQLSHELTYFGGSSAKGSPTIASIASLQWYFWILVFVQLYALPFLLFAIGIVFVFRRSDSAGRNLYPIVLILGSYAIFTLLRNKDARYTLPMLPAVAVVATSWLEYMLPRIRRLLSGVVVVYGAVAFLAISFGTSLLPASVTVGSTTGVDPGVTIFSQHGYIIGPPTHEQWHQQQVFEQIANGGGPATFAYQGPDSIWFNSWGTRYYALKYGLTWVYPAFAHFIVVRGADVSSVPPGFGQVGAWTLPGGEPLYLYKRFFS